MIMDETYIIEKIDVYETAIECLRLQESDSDIPNLSKMLRWKLADKLDREITRWCEKYSFFVK